jgi:phenylpropionate dioxygenase-like ring-hydroxylating dioxygenase large terminal subunit
VALDLTPRTPTGKLPEPELGTELIPKDRYLSADFMHLEWDRMWTRVWNLAGPMSDLAEVGDYFVFELGPESILVIRSEPDRIRAFYNVCQHRGRRIREPGCGHASELQCPYHLWTYGLDGTVSWVPDADDFPQGDPVGRLGLGEVRCETWNGWVFVNMDADAEPLIDFLGPLPEHLDPYDFARNYHLVEDLSMRWECNWKVGVDAFNEVYHVQGIHPELLSFTDDVDCPVDILGKHSRFLFRVGYPSPRWTDELAQREGYRDRNQVTQMMGFIMERAGLDPEGFDGRLDDVRGALFEARREYGRRNGLDYDALTDEQLTDDFHYFIFPNITLNISADHFWFFRHRPDPTDPERMFWEYQCYVRLSEGVDPPPRPERIDCVFGDGNEQKLHLALQQDAAAAPPVQAGMRSAGFRGLELAHQERRIRHFHRTLDEYLFGG